MSILNVKIKNRIDTSSNWELKNPVLEDGECGYISDEKYKGQYKIGDGKKHWNDLPYAFLNNKYIYFKNTSTDIDIDSSYTGKVLLVNGSNNINIPLTEEGFYVTIKNIGNNKVFLKPVSTTIDGNAGNILLDKYKFMKIAQLNNEYLILNLSETDILRKEATTVKDIDTKSQVLLNNKNMVRPLRDMSIKSTVIKKDETGVGLDVLGNSSANSNILIG